MRQRQAAEELLYFENFGNDDNVADVLGNLGVLLGAQGRHAEAEPLFRQSLELQRKTLGTEHLGFAGKAFSAAATYWQIGKRDEARELLDEGIAVMEKLGLSENTAVAYAHSIRAEWALQEGDAPRAEQFARSAVQVLKKLKNPQGVYQARLASYLVLLARSLDRQQRVDEALQAASEACQVLQLDGTPPGLEIANAFSAVGDFLCEKGHFSQAEPSFRRAHEIATAIAGDESNPTAEAALKANADHLTRLYERWHAQEPSDDRAANAAMWRARGSMAGTP